MRVFLLIIAIGLFGFAQVQADEKTDVPFQYDDKGMRDPFISLVTQEGTIITYETDFIISDLNLEGIVADRSGTNIAIINGRIVRAGDKVGNFSIKEILKTSVILLQGEKQFDLILKKGE